MRPCAPNAVCDALTPVISPVAVSFTTSRPAAARTESPRIVPLRFKMSSRAASVVRPRELSVPLALVIVPASIASRAPPRIEPLLARSPNVRRSMSSAAMSAPLRSRSRAVTRDRYTIGTSALRVLPSGSMTSRSTGQTMSLVSAATCASDRAIPARSSRRFCAAMPASISATNIS